MLQSYLRELSDYSAPGAPKQDVYEYIYFDAYWQEPDQRYPFLLESDGVVVGFAFVNRHSRLGRIGMMNMAEFYVLPEYRGSGIGRSAAERLFRLFPGAWEVAVLHGNAAADEFWQHVTADIASGAVDTHMPETWNGTVYAFIVDGE